MRKIIRGAYKKIGHWTGRALGMSVLSGGMDVIKSGYGAFLSVKKKPTEVQSFEAVVRKKQLTDQEIERCKKIYFFHVVLFSSLGIGVFIYACLHINMVTALHFLNYLALSVVCFICALRAHYYRFLISKRSLSISLRTWMMQIFRGEA